jgi:ribonuclease J
MEENVRLALELGYLRLAGWQLVSLAEARRLPPRELAVLATGTQGEPHSALSRLARGEHPELSVEPGDLVVLSSRLIPGKEVAIGQLLNALCRLGAQVAYDDPRPLHASGHAQEAEQRRLIALSRPERFVPIHGEFRHLARHSAHAAAEGVPDERRHLLVDGQVLELDDFGARVVAERLPTGRVYADRDATCLADIGTLVVKDRRLLAEAGLCLVVLAVDKATGAVVRGPEVFGKGVAGIEGCEAEIGREALRALADLSPQARTDLGEVEEALRLAVRRWFRREGAKKPAVLPVVLEL